MKAFCYVLRHYQYALFAAVGAMLILWQILLPGYVLTLDMVFGPHVAAPSYAGLSAASFPLAYLLYLLHFVLSVWIIEKIILFGLFFLLLYLPLRFYPFSEHTYGKYFASVLFTINPYVYERFLAGQWSVLMAYAFLFPFVSLLVTFYTTLAWRHALHAFAWLLLIGMFSLHLLVMGCIVLGVFALVSLARMLWAGEYRWAQTFLARLCACALLFALVNLYWVVPALTAPTTTLSGFSPADVMAFYTASDAYLGTAGNVAALYGFWGEHEYWGTTFILPKSQGVLWALSGIALAGILLAGFIVGLYRQSSRLTVLWLGVVGVLALIFSAGIGEGIFQNFNAWMFNHVWYWSGFRDTQKWSAVLAVVYALLGGLGASYIASRFVWRRSMLLALCFVPFLYTPAMLFGFSGQLQPVWYPSEWSETNAILKKDKNCVAVFLPWHLYYSPGFNNRLLTANTASSYFDCTIYQGANAEIGDVGDGGLESSLPEHKRVSEAIMSNTADPEATIQLLASLGIRYIIYTPDEAHDDPYRYPFLGSLGLTKVINTPNVNLYSLPR